MNTGVNNIEPFNIEMNGWWYCVECSKMYPVGSFHSECVDPKLLHPEVVVYDTAGKPLASDFDYFLKHEMKCNFELAKEFIYMSQSQEELIRHCKFVIEACEQK